VFQYLYKVFTCSESWRLQRILPRTQIEDNTGEIVFKTLAVRWGSVLSSDFTTKDGTQVYYKDWGEGQPVVFSHGRPLSADAWEDQIVFLGARGFRCIAHDRRGHG